MKHPEAGIRTQPHIAISPFNLIQVNTKHHFTLLIFKFFSWFVFYGTHTTLYLFASSRPVITILHYEPTGGRVCSSTWGSLRLNHPSTPVILWIRGAQGQTCLWSVHCLS